MTDQELKSVTLSDDDLKEPEPFFKEGVHRVVIDSAKFEKNQDGKIFLEVKVIGEENQKADARLWFTEKARPYSIDTIRKIFVHNAADDSAKDKIRTAIAMIKSLAELNAILPKLAGKECWYSIKKLDNTYIDRNGNEKNSYDKNLTSYKPTESNKNATEKQDDITPSNDEVDKPVDLNDIPF